MSVNGDYSYSNRRKAKPLLSKLVSSHDDMGSTDSWRRDDLSDRFERNKVHSSSAKNLTPRNNHYYSDDDSEWSPERRNTKSTKTRRASLSRSPDSTYPPSYSKSHSSYVKGDSKSRGLLESDSDFDSRHRPYRNGMLEKVYVDSDDEFGSNRSPRSRSQTPKRSTYDSYLDYQRDGRRSLSAKGSRSGSDLDKYSASLRQKLREEDDESRDMLSELPRNRRRINGTSSLPPIGNSTDFKLSRPKYTDSDSSEKSFLSGSISSHMSTKELRTRSFLEGSMLASGPLLGRDELERTLPDRKLKVFVGTYNMAEMKNLPATLDDFILPVAAELVQDMYVIGTQESPSDRHGWEMQIQETLGPHYVLYHSASLGSLYLSIFLRRDLIWYTSVVEESTVSTRPGIAGIRTKGSVGISFVFFGTSFLFINSHFTAHEGKSEDRIEDYKKTISSLNLNKFTNKSPQHTAAGRGEDVTSKFDCVFWMGDLNCRLEKDKEQLDRMLDKIERDRQGHRQGQGQKGQWRDKRSRHVDSDTETEEMGDYSSLMDIDELTRLIRSDRAFYHFQEGKIRFRPTYKYDMNGDKFDSSSKMRIPSYTDRVLFRSRTKNSVACTMYSSVQTMKESDHRPVYGVYDVLVRPGLDNIELSGGQFNREIWLQGCKRRSAKPENKKQQQQQLQRKTGESKTSSSVCAVM